MKKNSRASGKRGRRSRHRNTILKLSTYAPYVNQILKEIVPKRAISSDAMAIVNQFAEDIFERCEAEADRLSKLNSKQTITADEVRTAVKFLLPEPFGYNAVVQGNNSLDHHNETANKLSQ